MVRDASAPFAALCRISGGRSGQLDTSITRTAPHANLDEANYLDLTTNSTYRQCDSWQKSSKALTHEVKRCIRFRHAIMRSCLNHAKLGQCTWTCLCRGNANGIAKRVAPPEREEPQRPSKQVLVYVDSIRACGAACIEAFDCNSQ